jgi:hypothetical protein
MVEMAELPSVELLEEQARWLAPARARLLRGVALRTVVGCWIWVPGAGR